MENECTTTSSYIVEECSFTFIIENYSKVRKDISFSLESVFFPDTSDSHLSWQLLYYPNGTEDNTKYCELYLHNNSEMELMYTEFSFSVLDSNDEVGIHRNIKHYFEPAEIFGTSQLSKINDIGKYVNKDILKIRVHIQAEVFTLKNFHQLKSTRKDFVPIIKLANDFGSMLKSRSFTDFAIKVDGEEILVHKNVLASRSPVFLAMLKPNTLEQMMGYVEIEDMDKDTVNSLIEFIYTGKINVKYDVEARKLLYAADKYELLDLKQFCVRYLINNLNKYNIVDALNTAFLHSADEVFKYVVENDAQFPKPFLEEKTSIKPEVLEELSKLEKKITTPLKTNE